MTEDEARTRWCPMVRFSETGEDGANRWTVDAKVTAGNCCIASACMMWRPEKRRIEQTPEGRNISVVEGGYCGLAANP